MKADLVYSDTGADSASRSQVLVGVNLLSVLPAIHAAEAESERDQGA